MPSAFDIPEPIETPDLLDQGLIDRPEVHVSYRKGSFTLPKPGPRRRELHTTDGFRLSSGSGRYQFGLNPHDPTVLECQITKNAGAAGVGRSDATDLPPGAVRASWQKKTVVLDVSAALT
jgi:hypothetical protein